MLELQFWTWFLVPTLPEMPYPSFSLFCDVLELTETSNFSISCCQSGGWEAAWDGLFSDVFTRSSNISNMCFQLGEDAVLVVDVVTAVLASVVDGVDVLPGLIAKNESIFSGFFSTLEKLHFLIVSLPPKKRKIQKHMHTYVLPIIQHDEIKFGFVFQFFQFLTLLCLLVFEFQFSLICLLAGWSGNS
jgi:hypothetical protein